MLTLEQGAKFLIVAWAKDWGMRTLMDCLDERPIGTEISDERIQDLTSAFAFMPSHTHWYLQNRGRGASARKFVADAFPRLNEALWSAKDNAKRLTLAKQIERLSAGGVKASSRLSASEISEASIDRKRAAAENAAYRLHRESFKTHQRSAWNVCKG